MTRERDIYHESGDKFWVLKTKKDPLYYVMENGLTHAESTCAFKEPSLAVAYSDYRQAHGKQLHFGKNRIATTKPDKAA